ncbi:ChrR family anti-sigma-E factor [Pseudooceanicola aestuarii]|uniref:ChrR family anti-sigma-E factor n=1 Tax=Pseudooceanicola aestuarii TaxID=2697319 RepID=UPI0013D478F6|nr:ChrR family anti-sigma-E factor [Pseudooceanicola aestuarii]
MTITHHIPEALIASYAAGTLPYPFELVIAAHLSVCDTCRAELESHDVLGGALLDAAGDGVAVSDGLAAALMARLDETPPPAPVRQGIYPAPVAQALGGQPPRWRSLALGVKQAVLSDEKDGSVRLLSIPPGQAMPDHGHRGLELTLVLQGSFADETGHFGVGDVEVADEDLEHTPVAGPGEACICLAATDARLRFKGMMPRLAQPFFRI